MSFGMTPKNFLGNSPQQVSVRDRLADAFRRATAGMKSPAKVLSRITGKTPEMTERWLRAENMPNVEALLIACREMDDVWETVCELCGRDSAPSSAEKVLAQIKQAILDHRQS